MSIKRGPCLYTFHWCTNPWRNSVVNGFQSDWMTVHIPIQNGFAQRLLLCNTIENSYIKINRKILLSNGKIIICVRTRYQKVESENENVLHWQFTVKNSTFIYMKILVKFHFFHFNFFQIKILDFSFHWENCTTSVLHGE